jgi:hypothetical protein
MTTFPQLPLLSADHIWSPKMRAFGRFWAERRRGRSIPARTDFLAEEWGPWWTSMVLYRLEPDAARQRAYRLTYEGDAIEYIDGGSQIGRRLDEIAPPHLVERALAAYDSCVDGRVPVYTVRIGTWHRTRAVAFERLLLPLGESPSEVDHVVGLLFDHGIGPPATRAEGDTPPIAISDDKISAARIDPASLDGCDVTAPGKGLGLPMPGAARPA